MTTSDEVLDVDSGQGGVEEEEGIPSEVLPENQHYKLAILEIVQMARGVEIPITQFEEWFGIPYEDRKYAFQWLRLKNSLLWDHGVCLSRVQGKRAYSISTDEQVVLEHMERAWVEINRAVRRLKRQALIVDTEQLSDTAKLIHQRRAIQAGWVGSAVTKSSKVLKACSPEQREGYYKTLGTGAKPKKKKQPK